MTGSAKFVKSKEEAMAETLIRAAAPELSINSAYSRTVWVAAWCLSGG